MVSQGSICEEDGILPEHQEWDSDDVIPRTPHYEVFSSDEGGTKLADEELIDEGFGCRTIRRLQYVARRYKLRFHFANDNLEKQLNLVARLRVEAEEDVERISDLTTYVVKLALERDEARIQARKWKICACVVGAIAMVYLCS